VALRIKTVALRQNAHELDRMRRCASELGAPFRFDPLITPCLDGSTGPCSTRLDDASVVRLDVEDRRRREAWRECLEPEQRVPRDSLFTCGAGRTSFHVQPDGFLSLCLSDIPLHDLKTGSFREGWDGVVRQRRETALPADHPCRGCRDQAFCGVCPALARMETGSDLGVPEDLCRTGRRRLREVQALAVEP
jgi:radical SAM protein with 4Fe4S-binding SPASM domain